jgi:hypothetical protein
VPSYNKVFRDGQVHVCSQLCVTCIFRPGNVMDLTRGRLRQLVSQALDIDGAIPCHKTVNRDDVEPAVCRGFFDAYGDSITALKLARLMGMIAEDDPPTDWEP